MIIRMIIIHMHFDGGSAEEEHDIAHIASSIVARLMAGFFCLTQPGWERKQDSEPGFTPVQQSAVQQADQFSALISCFFIIARNWW